MSYDGQYDSLPAIVQPTEHAGSAACRHGVPASEPCSTCPNAELWKMLNNPPLHNLAQVAYEEYWRGYPVFIWDRESKESKDDWERVAQKVLTTAAVKSEVSNV